VADPRPFEGLRVVEFGRYVAAPYCAELFANGGADVVKIESIEGDETRSNSEIIPGEGRQFIIKARGKRDIALDLRSEAGLDIARRLVASSDIVVSNVRPGLLEAIRLDYESVRQWHPPVIYGVISGFGDRGPDAGRASIDATIQAYSGLLLSNRSWEDERPVVSEAFLSDYMAAMTLAFGITVALRQRDATGEGQQVTTSLMHAALALQHGTANVFDVVDGWKHDLVRDLERGAITTDEARQRRRDFQPGNRWFYNTYATIDGYVALAAPGRLRKPLTDILGIEDPAVSQPGWQMPDDPRPYLHAMYDSTKDAVAEWKTSDLISACRERGIPCTPIRLLEEVMLGPAASEAGMVESSDHPVVGPTTLPAAPLSFSRATYKTAGWSPAYGQHSTEILDELGFTPSDIEELIGQGVVGTPDTSPFAQ
jgi:crotonobetainyl-CoA:carnitine CoA-transferase CaiB-like acyl-CoA transferase